MHLSVCVLTCHRPAWLKRLLGALADQETGGLFTYSVVVVDNDRQHGAEPVVIEARRAARQPIDYVVEEQPNLARARNTAIHHATGDFIAFIDDDEFPGSNWLLTLYRTWQRFRVAGVLAPVVPHFEREPPRWVRPSGVFDRPRYPTGRLLTWNETRTGNVLFRRDIVPPDGEAFDPAFATHGEDRDFFKRMMQAGHRFVWCDEAVAYESQPDRRLLRRYHFRRALLRGSVAYGHATAKLPSVLTSFGALLLYIPSLPFLQLAGHHWFMKYAVKTCDHLGKLSACCGYRIERHLTQL